MSLNRKKSILLMILVICFTFMISDSYSVNASTDETEFRATAEIIAHPLNVRREASLNSEIIGHLWNSRTATIVAKAGDFYKINYENGYGYISNNPSLVKVLPAEIPYNAIARTLGKPSLNVRKEPDTTSPILGQLPYEGRAPIVAKAGGFYKIQFKDGYGYIVQSYQLVQVLPADTEFSGTALITAVPTLIVRKEPWDYAAKLGQLPAGTEVTIVAKAGGFYKIKYKEGFGYITVHPRYVTLHSSADIPYNATALITAEPYLLMRWFPSDTATIANILADKSIVTIVAETEGYYKIKYKNSYAYITNDERFVNILPEETPYQATALITAKPSLNVRNNASTKAIKLGEVADNSTVTIVAKAGDFYKIQYKNTYGYIFNKNNWITILP